MKVHGNTALNNIYQMLSNTFGSNVKLFPQSPTTIKSVSCLAKLKWGTSSDVWLGVDFVIPGLSENEGMYAPTLLRSHVSFYIKRAEDNSVKDANADELPENFWTLNQGWFDKYNFNDVAFNYKEHGWSGYCCVLPKNPDLEKVYFRPTRMFNISEVGWLADKVIEFIRMWCDV